MKNLRNSVKELYNFNFCFKNARNASKFNTNEQKFSFLF